MIDPVDETRDGEDDEGNDVVSVELFENDSD